MSGMTRAIVATTLFVSLFRPAFVSAQAVTIKREALNVADPKSYQITLTTSPTKTVVLTATQEGPIRQIHFALGDKVSAQAEAVRLDDTRLELLLTRAKAGVAVARSELKLAEGKGDENVLAAAKGRLDVAQTDLKLAEHDLGLAAVKIPFSGNVLAIHVVPGQYVKVGDPLLTIADTSRLLVEIPVDRSAKKVGDEVQVLLEEKPAAGKIQALLPPLERFESLRTLIHSLGTAVIEIDNTQQDYLVGQTVFTQELPQHAFAPVPTVAVGNLPDGNRVIQVLRDGIVRDIPVTLLSQVGTDRVFVAGPLIAGDEVVLSSSQPLKDGQQVRQVAGQVTEGTPTSPKPPTVAPNAGF